MTTERNILIAFVLNFAFSVFELLGGILTGSVAIVSDSIHDFGDALSIGLSYFLEKKSHKHPDDIYTYGYTRYSVLGAFITSLILLIGSCLIIINAVKHIIQPSTINYNGMILFAVIGVAVNTIAALITHGGETLNQKAVNLHMLEDVLGWVIVLIGAVVIKFTNFAIIDPVMSIGVAVFIFLNAVKNLLEIIDLFLEKTPYGINVNEIKVNILNFQEIVDVYHIHIWSLDGFDHCATLHVVLSNKNNNFVEIKKKIRGKLREFGINHVTIEFDSEQEISDNKNCPIWIRNPESHCHHTHSHHQH